MLGGGENVHCGNSSETCMRLDDEVVGIERRDTICGMGLPDAVLDGC